MQSSYCEPPPHSPLQSCSQSLVASESQTPHSSNRASPLHTPLQSWLQETSLFDSSLSHTLQLSIILSPSGTPAQSQLPVLGAFSPAQIPQLSVSFVEQSGSKSLLFRTPPLKSDISVHNVAIIWSEPKPSPSLSKYQFWNSFEKQLSS